MNSITFEQENTIVDSPKGIFTFLVKIESIEHCEHWVDLKFGNDSIIINNDGSCSGVNLGNLTSRGLLTFEPKKEPSVISVGIEELIEISANNSLEVVSVVHNIFIVKIGMEYKNYRLKDSTKLFKFIDKINDIKKIEENLPI